MSIANFPENEIVALSAAPTHLLIGGRWIDGSGGSFAVEDPATGVPIAWVADATPEDARAAMAAAADAQESWAWTSPRHRSDILRRAFDLIIDRVDQLALLMTLEMGKPLAESEAEVLYAAEFLRWFSEEAVRIDGRYAQNPGGGTRLVTMRQPVGPCLLITPWNFPLAMGTRKIGPALAAGCTVIVKPAMQTPLSMLALGRILEEAGLPDGVVNIVTTQSAGAVCAPLIDDRRLRKLSFTGSTPVGRRLASHAADGLLRMSMELGGNAPFLVFDDADLDAAVDGAVLAKMRNNGEACTAANRFLVQSSVASDFAERLTARLAAMRMGRGTEAGVEVGPLIDASQREKVSELVEDCVARGATVLTGGQKGVGPGYFFEATVLSNVAFDSRLLAEEIFGPVAPVTTFESEAGAVFAANNSEYGLAAYLYTSDLNRALRVGERLASGMVGVNTGVISNAAAPFGGVKQSGFGREGGREGIDEYVELKYMALAME